MLVCAGSLGQVQPTFSVLHVSVLAASAGLEFGTFSHVTPQHILFFSLYFFITTSPSTPISILRRHSHKLAQKGLF